MACSRKEVATSSSHGSCTLASEPKCTKDTITRQVECAHAVPTDDAIGVESLTSVICQLASGAG